MSPGTPHRRWRSRAALVCGLILLVAGCGGTARLQAVEGVSVCFDGECGPAAGRFTRDELLGGLLVMLKGNEDAEGVLCEADLQSRQCIRDHLTFFVQGGLVPGG